ncbi:hypothetical protein FTO70_09805 [Methanosarcina sp. KYL-1]|uniref:hypothetical protein n=1 Tax=Methanosarcina sp. KYL-1 TaxID=2602068 RepID=UPI002101CC84|nr:hypothetical protein [Methanosarcina sp. KYL-1]MCQ1535967.1 hypothetical protein [Methanosarcina sp. KYL-1]
MDRETTRDQNIEENEIFDGENLNLPDMPLPETDNVLHSILNSLNQNIADFYTFVKFTNYLSEDHLNVELLKRSMGIHRDFSALFLHTKEEFVFVYPEFMEKTEKLLFKGDVGSDCLKYTHKICKAVSDYKIALHREGYLPDLRRQLPLADI